MLSLSAAAVVATRCASALLFGRWPEKFSSSRKVEFAVGGGDGGDLADAKPG